MKVFVLMKSMKPIGVVSKEWMALKWSIENGHFHREFELDKINEDDENGGGCHVHV